MTNINPEFRKWATEFGEICGNLDAPLWICGIEPGGKKLPDEFLTPPEYTYRYNGQMVPCWNMLFRDKTLLNKQKGDRYVNWPFFRNSAKLAIAIVTNDMLGQWRNYYRPDTSSWCDDLCFGGQKGSVLSLNLYPLNYSNVSNSEWNDRHKGKTGFQSKEAYRAWCRGERFDHIRDLISQHHPAAIICTGNSNWWREDFIDTFGIQNIIKNPIEPKKLTDSHSVC